MTLRVEGNPLFGITLASWWTALLSIASSPTVETELRSALLYRPGSWVLPALHNNLPMILVTRTGFEIPIVFSTFLTNPIVCQPNLIKELTYYNWIDFLYDRCTPKLVLLTVETSVCTEYVVRCCNLWNFILLRFISVY